MVCLNTHKLFCQLQTRLNCNTRWNRPRSPFIVSQMTESWDKHHLYQYSWSRAQQLRITQEEITLVPNLFKCPAFLDATRNPTSPWTHHITLRKDALCEQDDMNRLVERKQEASLPQGRLGFPGRWTHFCIKYGFPCFKALWRHAAC